MPGPIAAAVASLVGCLIAGAAGCGSSDMVGPGRSDAGQTPALDARATDGANPDGSAGAGGSMDSGAPGGSGGGPGPDGSGRSDGAAIADGPSGPDVTAGAEGANASAFNWIAGTLNVDHAAYLSKHDIVYNRANTNPLFGLTVGNGRMGAMVWSANGLTMQVGAVDASQQSAFSSGLVNLNTTPAIDANTTRFQQILSLHDGTLTTTYDADRTVTIMGSPNSEVMGIHVEDARPGVSAIAVQLSLWDVSALANSGNVPNLNAWRAVSAYADATGAGFSRGQADPQNFGYTLAATVEGTPFTTQMVGANTVRLNITPASSYTIWFTSATRLNAPNHDSVAQARSVLLAVKDAGYAATLASFKDFWHGFWGKSFLQYSGLAGDADYLETFYYLTTYEIACGGFANYPFHFINGVFRATNDDTKWSNAYWYWNQRDVYNSFLASNHPEMLAVFNNMYSRNAGALKAYTMTRYNVAGIWVPETMGWDGNASGTIGSDFTKNIYSTAAEAAQNMYMQYAYTGDSTYLSATAYPFIREAANLYVGVLARDAGTGAYSMALSNSHETYWNVRNAITDLAAVRTLFPIAIKVSEALGLDANLRTTWQDVLDHLVPYPTDATDY
jgi:alpha-L-fucosidase 2